MKPSAAFLGLISEAVIFVFPLLSESCAFAAALHVKNAGFANGGGLLFLLAAVKLACSLFEYKGFEEAYLLNAVGEDSVFSRIGLLQLLQGMVLPSIVIAFAQFILGWTIDPLFVSLLIWTGILTSSRQFLSYHWRAQFKSSPGSRGRLLAEIAVAHLWLALLAVAALGGTRPFAQALAVFVSWSWKLWFVFVLIVFLVQLGKSGRSLLAGLSRTQWTASIGQAFTSQLSKEFFVMATTASLASGFVARIVLTLYGLVVVYPLAFFRIRIFDRHPELQTAETGGLKTADRKLRKLSLLLGAGCLCVLPLAATMHEFTRIDFPFAVALLAMGLTYPLVGFEILAYFELIKRGRRSMFSIAAAVSGVFAIIAGLIVARSVTDPRLLTFLFITILGASDFILNRVTKILAYR